MKQVLLNLLTQVIVFLIGILIIFFIANRFVDIGYIDVLLFVIMVRLILGKPALDGFSNKGGNKDEE